MEKRLKKLLILSSFAAWLLGIGGGMSLVTLTITGIWWVFVPLTAVCFVGAVIFSIYAAGYFYHRLKREYHNAAVPDSSRAEYYPELAPFFTMMSAQQSEIHHQLARVAKEKNRLSTIINNMDEGLIILDNDLKVIMLNESAYSWLGTSIPRAECTGRAVSEICRSPEICACIERADSVNLTVDGRHLQLHVNHVASGAEQVGRIGLMLDVTQRSEIDRIKQEFTANVSHELKTPLTSISGYAELIESGMANGDDSLVFAGRIRRESQRMLALISDIIKLSKLDEASDGDSYETVDLLSIANECRDMLEMSADQHGVNVSVSGERSYVSGVPGELTELIYNLIDNGIRYNRRGGEVNVKVTAPAHGSGDPIAIVTVSDTGIGIAEEHRSRVFERFYRVDKSRSKETGGTGLGLAIVKHVAERNGAKITLDSNVGKGTVMRVEFYEIIDKQKNKEIGYD